MRKQLFIALLLPGLLWALDQPAGWAQPSAWEGEARRVEQLYIRQDPTFGAALQQLRERPAGGNPGWMAYLAACDSLLHQDEPAACRFALEALKEPNDQLKMAWLRQLARRSANSRPDCLRLCIEQARGLQRRHPQDDLLLVGWLEIQGYEAGERGLFDLVESLHRSRWEICARHRWLEEQIRVGRQLQMDWDRLRELAMQAPAGRRREEMLLSILDLTPDAGRWQETISLLSKVSAQELLEREWFSVGRRATGWMKDGFTKDYARRLLALYQAKGQVEKEILLRVELADRDPKQADRQRRAAIQLRRDHPQPDPAYCPKSSLADMVVRRAHQLRHQGRPYEALELLQGVNEGRPIDLLEVHALGSELATRLGAKEQQAGHQRAELELLEKLPPAEQAARLGSLLQRLPEERARLEGAYEPVLRSQLQQRPSGRERTALLDSLSELLWSKKDEAGRLQLYQSELQRAQSVGDQVLLRWAQRSLLRYYQDHHQVREWKELATPLLQDPNLRPQLLESSWWLAYQGDTEGLLWAEDNIRICRQLQDRTGLAWALFIRAYAQLEMKRPAAALKDLLEAESLPGGVNKDALWCAHARALRDLGRPAEARKLLVDGLAASGQNLDVEMILNRLVEFDRQDGQDWEGDYEACLQRLEGLGPDGQRMGQQLLARWLSWLARDQKWERGLEVLGRHPWKLSPDDPASGRLRRHEPWKEQFGTPASIAAVEGDGQAAKVDELRLAHPELGHLLTLRSTNLPVLRKRLEAHDTLVTYCVLDQELVVLALRPGQSSWTASRVGAEGVAKLVQDYLANLRSDQVGQAEQTLHTMLLKPVLSQQPGQRLLIVPTGPLWQLPWGALRDEQGQAAAGLADVVLLSSGDLLRLADNSWTPYRLSTPLAIGAPPAADLPGAEQELKEISRVLPDCQLRSGAQATLSALRQADQPWGLVHFASHAHYNRKQPTESDIELSDGSLRLKQLDQLALADHSLVALSCCQGGESKGQGVDEPVTLATGFSAAGAETVIGNLWRVDDEVARVFFVAFYRELAQGTSPLGSFRQAQSQTRRAYPQTRDWGGFFLLGNPS